MDADMETLTRLIDRGVEFAVAYGFQILGALVVLVVGLIVSNWLAGRVLRLCERRAMDITFSRFVANVVRIVLIVFTIIITLGNFGITIAPFIALAGAGAFGATLALQGLLSNYAAGLSIIVTRPFVVGNTIAVKGVSGVVEDVKLAATYLRGEDGERITIPNKEIVGEILINSSANRIVESIIYVGVDAGTVQATEIIRRVIAEHVTTSDAAPPQVGIHDFDYGAIALGLRYWVPSKAYFQNRYAVNGAIRQALAAAGIKLLVPEFPARPR
ncbi:MAG: mechanosensitive ion channel [Proteobacteria bacterium]|nr:mechanosensitive ion channel [Pseudomonadota bacterium]